MTIKRTGQVFVEDFDVGIATTMGGELINVERDGELIQVYAVQVDGVTGPDDYQGLVPISMSDPDDAFQAQVLPQIIISRGAFTPQMNRWHPGGFEYQVAAVGAPEVSVPGTDRTSPTRVEKKWYSWPYEISYDVHLRAKLRVQADRLLKHVGRYFWAYGQVRLTDSENEERGYYAFVESIDSLSEISDVADRLQGHTISMRVEAELDFLEPVILPTQRSLTLAAQKKVA